jgi:hypothetical protein
MGATHSTLGQGEDPLILSFRQMIDRLDLDDEIQPAASRLLLCGVEIAINWAEWQKNSDDQIDEVIVSSFPCFFAVASWPCPHQPRSSRLSHLFPQTLSRRCLSKVLASFFGTKSHSSPRRRPHLHSLAKRIWSWQVVPWHRMKGTPA